MAAGTAISIRGKALFGGEILGIFLGEQQLKYAFLKKKLNKWSREDVALYGEVIGRNSVERLGSLLGQLKPKRGRRLCIAIPRNRYYLRELKFKGLSTDEAENSVRLSVATHIHLPLEDIYFDCWSYKNGNETHVLIAYTKRAFIDSIVEQVERSGHKKSLFCIAPCSLGNDILLRRSEGISFPCISLHLEEYDKILSIHGKDGWLGCHSVKSEDIREKLHFFGFNDDSRLVIFKSDTEDLYLDGLSGIDPCTDQAIEPLCKDLGWNLGLSAAALGTSIYPQIAFDQRPRKKPLRLRVNALQLALVGIFAILLLFTGIRFYKLIKVSRQLDQNVAVVKELEGRFAPLKAKLEKLQRLKAIEQDMIDFLNERPSLLVILKELAERTPMDAWIKYFTLRNNVLKVSAEGGSAVSTMEAWRKSQLFTSVKLVSPVTKDRQGRERYTVELKIKQFFQKN